MENRPDTLAGADNSGDIVCESSNFECNICFELARDPVVTLCGHLYCWPCLYSWLNIHSYSHECPVCKALIREEKLVPIYGRGQSSSDPRHPSMSGLRTPNRPAGRRSETSSSPAWGLNYFRRNEFGDVGGIMPLANARFGSLTLSAFFGAIPAFFNLQVHGFHDATVYGATSGVPYMFTSSFHGGYTHGLHNYSSQAEGARFVMKLCFLALGFLVIVCLLLS